jgi:hypothetical protein
MGHSAGGVDSLRKASGLFRTHSRVKEGGAAVLEAPAIASCVLARLVVEFFFVILFSTTKEKNCSDECGLNAHTSIFSKMHALGRDIMASKSKKKGGGV